MGMAHAAKPAVWRVAGTVTSSRLTRILELLAVWQRRASEREALRRLSDHHLRDIGLTRSTIMMEVAKPFWRA